MIKSDNVNSVHMIYVHNGSLFSYLSVSLKCVETGVQITGLHVRDANGKSLKT